MPFAQVQSNEFKTKSKNNLSHNVHRLFQNLVRMIAESKLSTFRRYFTFNNNNMQSKKLLSVTNKHIQRKIVSNKEIVSKLNEIRDE